MCMSTVAFASTYDKKREEFIGIGYKNLSKFEVCTKESKYEKLLPHKKTWKQASLTKGGSRNRDLTLMVHAVSNGQVRAYAPGFHIWTCEKDAVDYSGSDSSKVIVKVEFKDVIAFGTNEVYGAGMTYDKRPCIIARWMRLVEVIRNGV